MDARFVMTCRRVGQIWGGMPVAGGRMREYDESVITERAQKHQDTIDEWRKQGIALGFLDEDFNVQPRPTADQSHTADDTPDQMKHETVISDHDQAGAPEHDEFEPLMTSAYESAIMAAESVRHPFVPHDYGATAVKTI